MNKLVRDIQDKRNEYERKLKDAGCGKAVKEARKIKKIKSRSQFYVHAEEFCVFLTPL